MKQNSAGPRQRISAISLRLYRRTVPGGQILIQLRLIVLHENIRQNLFLISDLISGPFSIDLTQIKFNQFLIIILFRISFNRVLRNAALLLWFLPISRCLIFCLANHILIHFYREESFTWFVRKLLKYLLCPSYLFVLRYDILINSTHSIQFRFFIFWRRALS